LRLDEALTDEALRLDEALTDEALRLDDRRRRRRVYAYWTQLVQRASQSCGALAQFASGAVRQYSKAAHEVAQ